MRNFVRGKIGIIGSGFVGSAAAYAMVMSDVGREIVMVDLNHKRAVAEANDILHAVPFAHPIDIHAGDYADLAGCSAVVITAGVNQKPGEHGDSEVLAWSQVTISGMSLAEFCDRRKIKFGDEDRAEVDHGVRRAAYAIIEGKGATYYGIGAALARLTDVVVNDQRSILTACAPTAEVAGVQDVTVALPRLIGGDGILDSFMQPLSGDEEQALERSAKIVREAIGSLGY